MKHNALALCFMGLMGFAGTASATFSAGNSTPSPGATGQSTTFTYEARAGIGFAGFGVVITDPNDVIVDGSVQFQVFDRDTGAGEFVNCDGSNLSTAAQTNISCSQSGQGGVYALSRTTQTDLPNLPTNMRVVYSISNAATDGQSATFTFGAYCTGVQTPATDGCVSFNNTSDTQRDDSPTLPVANNGTVTITVSADRTLSFNPTPATGVTFPAGTLGSNNTQNIEVSSTGNQGTATVSGCAIQGAGASAFTVNPTSLTFNDADSSTRNLAVQCTYQASTPVANLVCSQQNANATAQQVSWALTCPAPNATPTVTVSPAGGSPIAVGSAAPNEFGTAGITFTATGGSGNAPFSINCSSTGAVQLALGGAAFAGQTANQALTGAQAPQQVRVGVQLTNNAQPAAGTVSCDITDAGGTRTVTYNVSAGAGISVPLFVPASSLWSQLALIALFLGLGGVVLVLRRNG